MEEVFIIVPRSVTLDDVADVLRRSWTLDEGVGVPYVQTGPDSTAYVAEPEVTRTFEEELALDHPNLWDRVRGTVGDHRILSLRYRDPTLAREVARAIATSELASRPMLLNADGAYLTPDEFLSRLDGDPPWRWSAHESLTE